MINMQFLNLPTELVSERILPFLKTKWVVALDSSVTVQAKRHEWIQTVSRIRHFENSSYEIRQRNLLEIHWLCARNIVFLKLEITSETSAQQLEWLISSGTFGLSTISSLYIGQHKIEEGALCRFLSLLTGVEDLTLRTKRAAVLSALAQLKRLDTWLFGDDTECPLANQRHPHLQALTIVCDLGDYEGSVVEYLQHTKNLLSFTSPRFKSETILVALGTYCRHLQTLQLDTGDLQGGLMYGTGIVAVAAGCPELRCIELSNTTLLTEAAITALGTGCTKVTKLRALMCGGITDYSLCAIGQHWSQLTELYITLNTSVTGAGIVAIAEGCPLLAQCKLTGFSTLTDIAVMALAEHCKQLTLLTVSSCVLITDAAIIHALYYGQSLKYFECKTLSSAHP